jgi:predicted GH43/DUF377 family glycosyl hydrolase
MKDEGAEAQRETGVRFFHSQSRERGPINWRYHTGALLMEMDPPFRVVSVCKVPLVSGNEEWAPGVAHWKPNVAIPYGATEHGDGYAVTMGINDAWSRVMWVGRGEVMRRLQMPKCEQRNLGAGTAAPYRMIL